MSILCKNAETYVEYSEYDDLAIRVLYLTLFKMAGSGALSPRRRPSVYSSIDGTEEVPHPIEREKIYSSISESGEVAVQNLAQ